jgi:acetyltransferase EpsM
VSLRILGAGGHAKVALEAWRSTGGTVLALHDDRAELHGRQVLGVTVAGALAEAIASRDLIHVAVGDNAARMRIGDGVPDDRCPSVVHASAVLSPSAALAAGVLVCAGAVVQANAKVGRHAIVNSQALVEHDCEIGEFVHLAPGARIGGSVRIGTGSLIGIGAVLVPGVTVGRTAIVGAGAVVIRDVPDYAVVVGNPARPMARR